MRRIRMSELFHKQLMKKIISLTVVFLFPALGFAQNILPDELADLLQKSGFERKGIGLYIQDVDAAKPLAAYQADKPLNPASVVKLVTTAASLGLLGSGYRWSTDVYYTGRMEGDTLKGDLYFRGNGDPYLTPERFWLLLNRVSILGIKKITGDVIVDSSYFQPEDIDYAAFDEQPYRSYNVGPNAVLVGFQATEFHFAADADGASAVSITPFPQSPRMRIVNNVQLVNGSCGRWEKRLTLNARPAQDVLEVSFDGRYSRDCGMRVMYRRVSEAQDHFQHFFLPIWQQLGGELNGNIRYGQLPKDAELVLQESSITLAEAVRLINKFSNNVMTRQVVLTVGAHAYGQPGTTEKGISAIEAWLKDQHLNDESLRMDNG